MTKPEAARAFLLQEVEGLDPFDFVALRPAGAPLQVVEIARREDQKFDVIVPGRPPLLDALPVPVRGALRDRGFASPDAANPIEPWIRDVPDAAAAVGLAQQVLREVFEAKPDAPLDIAHGSHRAEHEARQKLALVRTRVEAVVTGVLGHAPEQDADGDYVVPLHGVRAIVAPRVAHQGPVVVRVFAVTNVGMNVTPELGLFLARLNFGLMFGRFALAAEHQSIWFDETLLGEQFSDEELRFTIDVVASTAAQWSERLKQMFGGATHQEALSGRTRHAVPPTKPGEGGYL